MGPQATNGEGTVRLTIDGRVATVVLDRPPLHVLDHAMLRRLDAAVQALGQHQGVHVAIVRGAGERAFSAGVAIEDHEPARIVAVIEAFHGALRRLLALDLVTVAAVRGHCLGGGLELAMACDLLVAEPSARFGQPEIALGCFPPFAAARLPALVGPARANDLVLTGRTLDLDEADRAGLVSRRAAAGGLSAETDALVASLLAHSGAALAAAKRALRASRLRHFEQALAEGERIYRQDVAPSADAAEGVAAFLAKRAPRWSHR